MIRILCLYIWCLNALARRRGSNLFPSVYEWSHVHIFEPLDTMKRRWEISFHLFCNSFVWSLTKRHINITKTDIEPTRCIFSLHVCDGERLFWKLAHVETIYLNVCVCVALENDNWNSLRWKTDEFRNRLFQCTGSLQMQQNSIHKNRRKD